MACEADGTPDEGRGAAVVKKNRLAAYIAKSGETFLISQGLCGGMGTGLFLY